MERVGCHCVIDEGRDLVAWRHIRLNGVAIVTILVRRDGVEAGAVEIEFTFTFGWSELTPAAVELPKLLIYVDLSLSPANTSMPR